MPDDLHEISAASNDFIVVVNPATTAPGKLRMVSRHDDQQVAESAAAARLNDIPVGDEVFVIPVTYAAKYLS